MKSKIMIMSVLVAVLCTTTTYAEVAKSVGEISATKSSSAPSVDAASIERLLRKENYKIPMIGVPIKGNILLSAEKPSKDLPGVSLSVRVLGNGNEIAFVVCDWVGLSIKQEDIKDAEGGKRLGQSLLEWRYLVAEMVGRHDDDQLCPWINKNLQRWSSQGGRVTESVEIDGTTYVFDGSLRTSALSIRITPPNRVR